MRPLRLQAKGRPPYSFAFESFGVRVRITTDDPGVFERIPSVLPPDAHPCPSAAEEEFGLFSEGGGRYRFIRPDSPVSTGIEKEIPGLDLESALWTLENQLQVYIGLRAPNRIFVHAGVVAHEACAVVIPGRSFAGKSTLVHELVRAGAIYYSDEFAVIDERGLVHPYAAPLWLRDPSPEQVHQLEGVEARQASQPLPIGAVLVSSYRAGAQWSPRRISPGHGALAMIDNALSALMRPQEAINFIRRAVDGAVVLEGERGEAREMASELLKALAGELRDVRQRTDA